MKKYQLKLNGKVIYQSNAIYDLCIAIAKQHWEDMKNLSIWKDGIIIE